MISFRLRRFLSKILKLYHTTVYYLVETLYFTKKKKSSLEFVLIVKLDAIGDYVLFRNFLEILKNDASFKNKKIILIGNRSWKEIFDKFDSKFVFDSYFVDRVKLFKNPFYFKKVLSFIDKYNFEYAFNPSYSRDFISDLFIKHSAAKKRVGFEFKDVTNIYSYQAKISDRFYTNLIKPNEGVVFEFYRNKEFFENILFKKINLIKPTFKNKNNYKNSIVVFPGAGEIRRQWSEHNFAQAIIFLQNKYPSYNIFICGSNNDYMIGQNILNKLKSTQNVFNLCGQTKLSEFVELLGNTKLLISNETSSVHIGVAASTKNIICISNGNHLFRFNPYPPEIYINSKYFYPAKLNKIKLSGKFSFLDINKIDLKEVILFLSNLKI